MRVASPAEGDPAVVDAARHVLILQHPQEPGQDLGTAELAHSLLPNSTLRVGLSWRNLSAALGREDKVDPKRWLALYFGSGPKGPPPRGQVLFAVEKRAFPVEDPSGLLGIDGIVVHDGTWSQAKSLWWRNAWLLKLRRGILVPRRPSLYGRNRREPRRECVSTIEAIGQTLVGLGESPAIEPALTEQFAIFLANKRGSTAAIHTTPRGEKNEPL